MHYLEVHFQTGFSKILYCLLIMEQCSDVLVDVTSGKPQHAVLCSLTFYMFTKKTLKFKELTWPYGEKLGEVSDSFKLAQTAYQFCYENFPHCYHFRSTVYSFKNWNSTVHWCWKIIKKNYNHWKPVTTAISLSLKIICTEHLQQNQKEGSRAHCDPLFLRSPNGLAINKL